MDIITVIPLARGTMFRTRPKYRRLEMMMRDVIPAQSEIRRCMGSSMAEVFFYYCHPDSRQLLGVIPPLRGPHKELWISPSDQLIEKVALVPPLTNKCIKACTHQGILAIGQKAMKKHESEMYDEMVKKYEAESGETRNMFEAEKRRAIQLSEQEIRSKYENYIDALRGEFERKLQTALAEAFRKCTKSMQRAVVKERIGVTRMMLQKLRNEITYVVNSVYESFEESVRAQKENMVADFNEIIRRERAKIDVTIKEMERKKDEALQIQRHELEMQNFADVTYVLCLERMRSSSEKHAIHLCFEKKIQALKTLLVEANGVLNLMKTETVVKETDQKSWENKLLKVVREFQKFINFAFKAVPGQAEFLLSLESLLILETDDKLRQQKVPKQQKSELFQTEANPQFEVVEIIDYKGEKWIPMQLIPDLPKLHCTKDQLLSPIVKSEIDLCTDEGYIAKPRDPSVVSLHSDGSLPFCCLEDVLYVRSDYHEKNEVIAKTMSQLAKGSRFIMELKKEKKPCNLKLMEHITSSISSSAESSRLNLIRNSAERINSAAALSPATENRSDTPSNTSIFGNIPQDVSTERSGILQGISGHLKMAENVSVSIKNSKETFRVIGEDGIEHLQTAKDFTCARMKSLIRIFKLHPSLQQLMIPKANEVLD